MLFSSINHIWVLLLFIYLGLVSGLVFFGFSFLINKVEFFLLKPRKNLSKKLEEKQLKLEKKQQKMARKKPKESKKENARNSLKPLILRFKNALNKVKKIKKFLVCFICTFAKIVVLFFVTAVSYLVNLQLNFGYLSVGFLLIYVTFFFIAKRLLNLVAIYLLNFYNYFVRKFKRRGKEF